MNLPSAPREWTRLDGTVGEISAVCEQALDGSGKGAQNFGHSAD